MLYRLAFTCILSLAVTAPLASGALAQGFQMPGADQPVAPQGATPPAGGDGSIGSILENLLVEAQPHLEGLAGAMQGTLQELSPALRELGGLVDDIENYQRPERLPNGDIILRRRADAPPPPPTGQLEQLVPGGDPQPGTVAPVGPGAAVPGPASPNTAVPAPVVPARAAPGPATPNPAAPAPITPAPTAPVVPTGPAPRVTL